MSRAKIFQVEEMGSTMLLSLMQNISSLADANVKPELDDVLEEFKKPDLNSVVVDFEQVSYFGSSMLEALRRLWNCVHENDGQMALCNLSDTGKEILHVARFDTLWPVCGSREEAMSSVAAH